MSREAGKGSQPRPLSIAHDEYATRWDMVFGNKKDKEEVAFVREIRYDVIKKTDRNYLTELEQDILDTILNKIAGCRVDDGKEELKAVVVESDWPEYETVWKLIESRLKK